MAEVKREISSLGQKVVGLKAGDTHTIVLKRPKPRVDAENAKKAQRVSASMMKEFKNVLAEMKMAKESVERGASEEAETLLQKARDKFDAILGAVVEAKDHLKAAVDDAKNAPGEVKDAYDAAKESADLAIQHVEKAAEGVEKAVGAVGALIHERFSR